MNACDLVIEDAKLTGAVKKEKYNFEAEDEKHESDGKIIKQPADILEIKLEPAWNHDINITEDTIKSETCDGLLEVKSEPALDLGIDVLKSEPGDEIDVVKDINITDVELLIEEVERRPPIFNKSLNEYSNIILKKQLWEEVCAAVTPTWNNMTAEQKAKTGLDIQKKWLNLRNCFARELRFQKSEQNTSKRRKYMYFEKLMFLLPNVENRDTQRNLDEPDFHREAGTENEPIQSPPPSRKRPAPRKDVFEESVLKILERKNTIDEDVNFALSLVPFLRSLDDEQKMEAKIRIMNLLKLIRWPPRNNDILSTYAINPSRPPVSRIYPF